MPERLAGPSSTLWGANELCARRLETGRIDLIQPLRDAHILDLHAAQAALEHTPADHISEMLPEYGRSWSQGIKLDILRRLFLFAAALSCTARPDEAR